MRFSDYSRPTIHDDENANHRSETAALLSSNACIKSSCINSDELRFERRDLGTHLLSQSQHNTYDVMPIGYGSATTRYGATRTFARRSFKSSRIRNIMCSASSRTAWSFAYPRPACTSSSADAPSFAHCSCSAASCCARPRLERSDRRAVAACHACPLLLVSALQRGVLALEDPVAVADAVELFYICLVRMQKVVPVALL